MSSPMSPISPNSFVSLLINNECKLTKSVTMDCISARRIDVRKLRRSVSLIENGSSKISPIIPRELFPNGG